MSRTEALRTFTVEDLVTQTEGVECRKDAAVLDEIPGSYKDIDTVMANQADLVEVVHTLKQVLCVKGEKTERRKKKAKKPNLVERVVALVTGTNTGE